jgi:hypothetical protein
MKRNCEGCRALHYAPILNEKGVQGDNYNSPRCWLGYKNTATKTLLVSPEENCPKPKTYKEWISCEYKEKSL